MTLCTEYLVADDLVCTLARSLGDIRRVFLFVRDRIRYVREPVDRWKTPRETLEEMRGDCEDKALLLAAMLGCIGVDAWVRIARVKLPSGEVVDHAYVIARDGLEWIELDPSCSNCDVGEKAFTVLEHVVDFTRDLIRVYSSRAEKYVVR